MAPPGEMGPPARSSIRYSLQQDNNEYDLEALGGGISDGFRFNQSQQQQSPVEVSQVELPPLRGQSLIQNQFNNTNPPPRPSSISKPKFASDNFALRHDGAMGPLLAASTSASAGNQLNQASLLSRASSVSTVSTQSTIMRSESPYQGPTGPSFPYQMYPQNTRAARTMSVATTSTAAVLEQPYEGPAGPTHPYVMYPQSITPADTPGAALPAAAIPVGFPGLNNDYQRRIGPEGEETADIIGSDGHTEQLPPYTQYPDEALARKTRAVAVPALAVGAGAGGLGLATMNPEFDSPRDEAQSPLSRMDRSSMLSHSSSQQTSTTTTVPAPEKPELKHWQVVAKRKVCGIVPIWVFVMMGITLLLMAAILAGVLTALKPKHHKDTDYPPGPLSETSPETTVVYPTVTTTFDAKSTTVPASFPTLPTGTFGLMLGSPGIQTDCITNSAQRSAWSCDAPEVPISINITLNDTSSQNTAILSAGQNIYSYNYGTQPPIVSGGHKLDMVIDIENPNYGPAWFFQVPYNKLIVLHQTELSISTSSSGKRAASFNPSTNNLSQKSPAEPGDMPWFCYWNGTLLEIFIYPNQTSAAGLQEASLSSAYPTSITSASSAGSYSASRTSSGSYTSPTTRSDRKRQVVSGTYSGVPPPGVSGQPAFLSGYPKVVKIEERRIPEGELTVQPYCVSMSISNDGIPSPNLNSTTGQPIRIDLNETDPSLSKMSEKRGYADLSADDSDLQLRDSPNDIPGDCSCVWMAS